MILVRLNKEKLIRISTILEVAKGLEVHPQELFDFEIDEKL